jgi:hypothetical protein
MHKKLLLLFVIFISFYCIQAQVHTFYLWHLHQPTYWGDLSKKKTNRYQVTTECGIEWSVITNSHLSKTLFNYPLKYGNGGTIYDVPNKANQVDTKGNNWISAQKDARGAYFAIPYS